MKVGDLVRCTWSDSLGVVVALKDRPPLPGHWVDFLSQRNGTVILMDSRELEVMIVLRSDK